MDLLLGTSTDVGGMVFPASAELLHLLELTNDDNDLVRATRDIPWARPGGREIRYYQERAVENVVKALGDGRENALVTLATGTGKTMIAMPDDGGAKARWRKTFP